MNILDVVECVEGNLLTSTQNTDREISYGYSCDLLSHVMANARSNCVWVTVQTHLNIVAVASLLDISCIVVPESIEVEETTLQKAEEEKISIIASKLTAFEICGRLYDMGVKPCK